jgi:hypothetical protein
LIYRNIGNAGTLNDLAILLDAPGNWEFKYNQLVSNGYILRMLNRFSELADATLESDIRSQFVALVSNIAFALEIELVASSETHIIVCGILVHYQYDIRSKTDPHFFNVGRRNVLASEVKKTRRFAPCEMWYHSSRGIQVLTALYSFNCPTFFLSQRQWKLFIENKERNALLTFPYNDDSDFAPRVNSSLVQPMGTTFLKAIVIFLLSTRGSSDKTMNAFLLGESSQVKETPGKCIVKAKHFDTPEKPRRKSPRLQKLSALESEKTLPSFFSGYVDGEPVYKVIRVVPQEVVVTIEEEIAKEGLSKAN